MQPLVNLKYVWLNKFHGGHLMTNNDNDNNNINSSNSNNNNGDEYIPIHMRSLAK